ncbi:hypothetical protein HMN09_00138400 [Mycena chlorophos]|uniref:Uncharacterized protein n=1 Tax=Mycena chlorophos TaxID=658473 RepID=A0A8H6TPR4_MYCCL|nr:hypothetical protein HMN09_00138400 [Mycena chlorophos]
MARTRSCRVCKPTPKGKAFLGSIPLPKRLQRAEAALNGPHASNPPIFAIVALPDGAGYAIELREVHRLERVETLCTVFGVKSLDELCAQLASYGFHEIRDADKPGDVIFTHKLFSSPTFRRDALGAYTKQAMMVAAAPARAGFKAPAVSTARKATNSKLAKGAAKSKAKKGLANAVKRGQNQSKAKKADLSHSMDVDNAEEESDDELDFIQSGCEQKSKEKRQQKASPIVSKINVIAPQSAVGVDATGTAHLSVQFSGIAQLTLKIDNSALFMDGDTQVAEKM